MSMAEEHRGGGMSDALIDEVRSMRCELSQRFGDDVDRLCDHLQQVEREYQSRSGVFAGVSKTAAAKVLESWGEEPNQSDDPLIDEVRAIRKEVARGS